MSEKSQSAVQSSSKAGAWRDAPYLVVRKSWTDFPDRCILCNAPAEGIRIPMRVRATRRSDAVLVFLIMGIFMFLFFFFLPSVVVRPGFCRAHRAAWRRWQRPFSIALMVLVISNIAFLMIPIIGDLDGEDLVLLVAMLVAALSSILSLLATLTIALLRPSLLTAKKIDTSFVWLEKVSQEYLAQFPQLPGTEPG